MKGSCLCGDVRFHLHGPTQSTTDCHCTLCRKWSGHHWASFTVAQDDLMLDHGAESVAWYLAPAGDHERGFCVICGSSLFWRRTQEGETRVAVSLGALDGDTGLSIDEHIFVAYKGDYYPICDDAPQFEEDGE